MKTSFLRSLALGVIGSCVAASAATAQSAAPLKIAYINSQKLLSEAPGRADAEAQFDKEYGSMRAQLQRMDDSLKAMVTSYEKDAPGLDSARRETRGKAVRDREQEYQERAQTLNQQMQQRQSELARPLMEQVTKVLEEFRAQNGYALILDVASPANVVVAADKSLDITDQVLARLKQAGPPSKATAEPAPAPSTGPAQKPAGVKRPKG